MVWVCAMGGVILLALDLPLLTRLAMCICTATISIATIHSVFLLGGPNAIRALRWSETGTLHACVGRQQRELAVVLAPGTFRLGCKWLLLWLRSCDGIHAVFIEANRQDPQAFRRLCRRLECRNNALPGVATDRSASAKLIPSRSKD